MNEFAFGLGQTVTIKVTGDFGTVTGVAMYLDRPNEFGIEYMDGAGKYAYNWFLARQLALVL